VVVVAVLLALSVAAAVWWRPIRPVLVVAVVFCLGTAVLDVREVVHQLNQNRNGVATLAGLVAVLHLLAAAAAALSLRRPA
jgi:choline-glycine betaine transporter